jgi:hypothetical protein
MAVNIQLAADGAGEYFIYVSPFCRRQSETDRRGGNSSPI